MRTLFNLETIFGKFIAYYYDGVITFVKVYSDKTESILKVGGNCKKCLIPSGYRLNLYFILFVLDIHYKYLDYCSFYRTSIEIGLFPKFHTKDFDIIYGRMYKYVFSEISRRELRDTI